jgi:hypothetical protein
LVLELRCTGGTLAACPLSSSLVFVVAGSAEAGFLSAYAEPLSAGAERVWYFSRETNSPELPGPLDGTHVFDRAVQLIGSHRAGRYRVHAFVSEQPLARAELLSLRPNRRVHTSLHAEITLTAGD